VTSTGIIQHKLLTVDEDLSQDYLDKITRYLNEILAGLTLGEVRKKIVEEMKKEKVVYDRLMGRAMELSEKVLVGMEESELFIEGKAKIFDAPEFSDTIKMKKLLQALEEKGFLLKLLDQSLTALGVQIVIGSEFEHREMEKCSLVMAAYGTPDSLDSPRGTLGVIGPIRMDYSRVIPLVDFTARLLTENLSESEMRG
jgi:heat-inducible transcriptional repressor